MKQAADNQHLDKEPSNKWHFLSFGGGSWDYRRAAKKIGIEAINSKIFENIFIENDKTLRINHNAFYQSNSQVLESYKRGYGYWLWKPYLINYYLHKIPYGEGLLYLDSGCEFNINEKSLLRFAEYTELVKKEGSLAFSLGKNLYDSNFSEDKWTKRATLEYLKIDNDLLNESQVQATAILMLSNPKNFDFLNSWMNICGAEEYRYLLDTSESESEKFIEHRHDQSIFSCLYKKSGMFRLENEIYFGPDWQRNGEKFPIWGKRHRTGLRTQKHGINDLPDVAVKLARISKHKIKKIFKVLR